MDDWLPIALVFTVLIINVAIILSPPSLRWIKRLKDPVIALPILPLIFTWSILSITIADAWMKLRTTPNPSFVIDINWLFIIGLIATICETYALYILHSFEWACIFLGIILLVSAQLLAMSLQVHDETPAIFSAVRIVWAAYVLTWTCQLHDLN